MSKLLRTGEQRGAFVIAGYGSLLLGGGWLVAHPLFTMIGMVVGGLMLLGASIFACTLWCESGTS